MGTFRNEFRKVVWWVPHTVEGEHLPYNLPEFVPEG
jgi:hypothetical protein